MADDVVLIVGDINIASSGDNTVIAATTGKKTVVYKIWFVVNGAVNIKFKDGSTDLNAGAIHLTADGSSLTLPFDGKPHFGTTSGSAFKMNLSGAVQVSGQIYYALV